MESAAVSFDRGHNIASHTDASSASNATPAATKRLSLSRRRRRYLRDLLPAGLGRRNATRVSESDLAWVCTTSFATKLKLGRSTATQGGEGWARVRPSIGGLAACDPINLA
jgi:hypothetical protein